MKICYAVSEQILSKQLACGERPGFSSMTFNAAFKMIIPFYNICQHVIWNILELSRILHYNDWYEDSSSRSGSSWQNSSSALSNSSDSGGSGD
ncbi:uncharacterized protein [Polyergus mexicanus]|uniref:uncharacterized protein isoform X2 n=1 Tax=Polyergus mexicanus TaxID=615972 RepID=UPI0038B556F5